MERINFVSERNLTVNDFGRVCRTCLSTVDLQPMSDVFNIGYFPAEVALHKYTQVQFDPCDNLPKQICSICVRNLNSSYNFLLHCDSVNKTLRQCLVRHESKLQSNAGLPKEIEYVNCEIKQENGSFEPESNEYNMSSSPLKATKVHTAVQIKEEVPDNSEDENYLENFDSDGELIVITNVEHNKVKIPEKGPEVQLQVDIKSDHDDGEIIDINESAGNSSLPAKSRERYESIYRRFMEWKLKNKIDSFSETVLLKYFQELAATMKPSSLWAIYSMLRTTININHEHVNIAEYANLIKLLKIKSRGFKSIKSKTFTTKDFCDFLQNAPDYKYLFIKVVLIFGITGACRKQELRNIKPEHVEDTGKSLIIFIADTKAPRYFVVSEVFYSICKKYMRLRPHFSAVDTLPFFVNYVNERCTKQCVGINKFSRVPQRVAEYLGLPEANRYTGHCFRRSSPGILADAGKDNLLPLYIKPENEILTISLL